MNHTNDLFFFDAETYYATDYSLTKMTTIEYLCDKRFEFILGSYILVRNGLITKGRIRDEKELIEVVNSLNFSRTTLIAHNVYFDGSMLFRRYGAVFNDYICTIALSRYIGVSTLAGGASLAKLTKFMIENGNKEIVPKGTEVVRALGKRKAAFTRTDLERYAVYCDEDTHNCFVLYNNFIGLVPAEELAFQSMILKCGITPALFLDPNVLLDDLERVLKRKQELITDFTTKYAMDASSLVSMIMSNEKFANALRDLGGATEEEAEGGKPFTFIIPTKISARTGKLTYAFAKTDEGMEKLVECEYRPVAALASIRLGIKSTIEETRLKTMLSLSRYAPFSIPYLIGGAHTQRLSGTDKINMQNMPSGRVEGQSKAMRKSLIAPAGFVVCSGDSSQIEYRVLAYMANNTRALNALAEGIDPYSYQASIVFGGDPREIKKLAKAGVEPYSSVWRPMGKAQALGLGFGMGAAKFIIAAKMLAGMTVTPLESESAVSKFRATNPEIPIFWTVCNRVLAHMIDGGNGWFGGLNNNLFYYDGSATIMGVRVPSIRLPNGTWLRYFNLRYEDKDGRRVMLFDRVKGSKREPQFIWGGSLTENLTQALAFAILKFQGVEISKRYRVVLNTHDEWAVIVPHGQEQEGLDYLVQCMKTVPDYAEGLPLECEASYAPSYGDCK